MPYRSATAAIALAAATALALTGCGRAEVTGAASVGSIDDSPATGTVTLWASDGDATALETTIAPFLDANPDVDVEITLIPASEYGTKLQAAISAGNTPDVALMFPEAQAQFLDPAILEPVPDGVVDSSTFFPGVWDAGVADGVAYTVPWYAYTYALVYRSDFAEAGGVTPPATWDDTIPFFEGLQAGGGEYGIGTDVGWDLYNGQNLTFYTWQQGGDVLSADGSEWTLDTPEMISAIEYNNSFFSSGAASPDGPGFLDAIPYFVEGKTASMITGPWVIGMIDGVASEEGWMTDHVATAPLPAGSAGSTSAIGGGTWSVMAGTENSDASWKLIRYLAQPETQVAQFSAYGSMPAVESAWDDPAIADQPLLSAFFTQLQGARTMPAVGTWTQITTQLGSEMEAVVRGVQTPEEAAANIQEFADGLGTE